MFFKFVSTLSSLINKHAFLFSSTKKIKPRQATTNFAYSFIEFEEKFQPTCLLQSTRLLSRELRVIGKRQLLLDHPQFGTQVLSQLMPCPFTGPKMFWAGPNFCARPKIYLQFYIL